MSNASTISISQMLEHLDGPFAALAAGIAKQQYAFWLGSGISRERVDDLQNVIHRVLTHLRDRIDQANDCCSYRRALKEALDLARLSPDDLAAINFAEPIDKWLPINTVLRNLTSAYAQLLDIRIDGCAADYLMWEVVDVPASFAPATAVPDCEHICIAILVLEGVLSDIASANWDGLIEAAVGELSENSSTALRVCVRSVDMREPPLPSRLLKFHGCAVRAGLDPATYRSLLIARRSQVTDWPSNSDYAFMRHALESLAATKPTLMIGMSAQDSNIQQVFAAGKNLMKWGWPSDPPAHVFAEDSLGEDQKNILRVVYQAAYDDHRAAIEESALLRAYAKPALTALVLHVLCTKLRGFASAVDAPHFTQADHEEIGKGIFRLRNRLACKGEPDRLAFIRAFIAGSARAMALFQAGSLPAPASRAYHPVSAQPIQMIPVDANLATSGIREMAAAIGLLGLGDKDGIWAVEAADPTVSTAGAIRVVSAIGSSTRVFFAANARAGIQLEINGIATADNSDAIIIHSTSPVSAMPRSPSAALGRTGRVGLRQVGMVELLSNATNIHELRRCFREVITL